MHVEKKIYEGGLIQSSQTCSGCFSAANIFNFCSQSQTSKEALSNKSGFQELDGSSHTHAIISHDQVCCQTHVCQYARCMVSAKYSCMYLRSMHLSGSGLRIKTSGARHADYRVLKPHAGTLFSSSFFFFSLHSFPPLHPSISPGRFSETEAKAAGLGLLHAS